MPTLACPRAIAEPPTCTHPQQVGELRFRVLDPDSATAVGYVVECDDQTCECDLTEQEWVALERTAVKKVRGDG